MAVQRGRCPIWLPLTASPLRVSVDGGFRMQEKEKCRQTDSTADCSTIIKLTSLLITIAGQDFGMHFAVLNFFYGPTLYYSTAPAMVHVNLQ